MPRSRRSFFVLSLLLSSACLAQTTKPTKVAELAAMPDDFFKTPAADVALKNVLSFQNADGGFPKNFTIDRPFEPGVTKLEWEKISTIDNNATFGELRVIAKAFALTGKPEYRDAFNRGLDFLFAAQYANGGWPQRFPPPDNYGRQITFNDNAFVGVMSLLMALRDGKEPYAFVDDARRAKAKDAFGRGLDCILKCQVRDASGKPTGWAGQHDAVTLAPTNARVFEPACLTLGESAGMALFLMSIPEPDARLREAIDGVAAWYDAVKILGQRVEEVPATDGKPRSKRFVPDASAKPLWPRFVELGTNRPIFIGRDGVVKYAIDEIDSERAYGYRWYSTVWGVRVAEEYAAWKKRKQG
jgi:PelA/Pel-15E family pectate lyase